MWSLGVKSKCGFCPKVLIGRLFSFPPAARSSSGRLGKRNRKSLILPFTSSSVASTRAISSPKVFISAMVAETSIPAFLSLGTSAETLLRCAFMVSTCAIICFLSSSHFKKSVKSMSLPRLRYLSLMACGFCLIRLTSIIISTPLVISDVFCPTLILPHDKNICNNLL
ncbi:unknown [Corallococcus sp. CAG:1435]|nr:unknown [Corallococcus sp. CAG:1435]